MTAHRHVTHVDHGAAHEQIDHYRVASSHVVIATVWLHTIVGSRHLVDINRAAVGQLDATRELVEEELPVGIKWTPTCVLDYET